MDSFLALAEQAALGDEAKWAAAAQCLAVPDALGKPGPERAKLLYEVLTKLEAEPGQLPDQTTVQQAGESTWQFFPRILEHSWVSEQLDSVEKLGQLTPIVLARQESGNWLFSEQTVQRIPDLAANLANLKPRATEDRFAQMSAQVMSWVGPSVDRTDWWQWVALLIAVAAGLVLGKIVQWVCNRIADRLERKTGFVRASFFRSVASPASLTLFTLGLAIGVTFIHTQPSVERWLASIHKLLFLIAAGWFFYNLVELVDIALRRAIDHANHKKATKKAGRKPTTPANNKINEMVIPMIRKMLRIFVVVVVVLTIASSIFQLNITGLIAGLGVAGLAISLAAQESVKNFLGSLTVFFDKPFVLGDFITFGEYTGVVEDIGFRSTRLRLLTGHLVTIPNMKFIDGDIENIGARPYIRRVMDIPIPYDAPAEKLDEAVSIVEHVLNRDPAVVEQGQFDMKHFPPRISFDEFNDASLNIKAYYWYQFNGHGDRTYWTYLDHCQLVNRKLFEQFERAGIEFAFPTQTLYLAGDSKRQLDVCVLQSDGQPATNGAN